MRGTSTGERGQCRVRRLLACCPQALRVTPQQFIEQYGWHLRGRCRVRCWLKACGQHASFIVDAYVFVERNIQSYIMLYDGLHLCILLLLHV
jgi:hypothetical protein